MVLTFSSQKGRQIVDRDWQCGGLDWRPALIFIYRTNIYIGFVLIVDRLHIVLLDDTLLSFGSLVQFRQNMKHKYPKYVFTALETPSNKCFEQYPSMTSEEARPRSLHARSWNMKLQL